MANTATNCLILHLFNPLQHAFLGFRSWKAKEHVFKTSTKYSKGYSCFLPGRCAPSRLGRPKRASQGRGHIVLARTDVEACFFYCSCCRDSSDRILIHGYQASGGDSKNIFLESSHGVVGLFPGCVVRYNRYNNQAWCLGLPRYPVN